VFFLTHLAVDNLTQILLIFIYPYATINTEYKSLNSPLSARLEEQKLRVGCNTLYPDVEKRNTGGWCFEPEFIINELQRLTDIGYTNVEYSHIAHLSLDEAAKIGEEANRIGINSWSSHSTFVSLNFDNQQQIEESAASHIKCVDICAAIGAGRLVVHPSGAPTESSDDEYRQRCFAIHVEIFEMVCSHARDKNVIIALENGGSLAQMEYIVELVDKLKCGICVDTGHANLGNLGAARAIRMAGQMLATTHLQDNYGKVDDHLPPGMGAIDWMETFKAIKEIGYKGTLMLELTDSPPYSRDYNQQLEMKLGIENVRKFAESVGL